MRKLTISTFVLSTLLLAACGGSDSAIDTAPVTTPDPIPSVVMPSGVWQGTYVYQSDGFTTPIVALITPNGEARLIVDNGYQAEGKLNLDGQSFSGDMVFYSIAGFHRDSGTFKGSYTPEAITAEMTVHGNVISKVSLTLDSSTGAGASFEKLAGTFVTEDQKTSIGIDKGGAISGSNMLGCTYGGSVQIPDADINVYALSIDVSSCDVFDGSYSGLGTVQQKDGVTGFIFQADNGQFLITDYIYK
ncbi:hypothetical protein FM038_007455 [Shewanella eurypsychrophilus]|uniref:Lipoprotein n=1 Tax=Shewanella eurypsychrophilus TaxID=2593656 RepID=A0ABX6V601_9GAMM|nr:MULTISPECIES: hypothetical protein [Shewanella]QFU22002.1 hypothetical protein FS418_09035 [Shewanella sp. YLB-09]QPG57291.1 hypothetical protein FM038_007455 [Shewanella eurypsychrophilus]